MEADFVIQTENKMLLCSDKQQPYTQRWSGVFGSVGDKSVKLADY